MERFERVGTFCDKCRRVVCNCKLAHPEIIPETLLPIKYLGTPEQKRTIECGRYLVMRKDGKMHLEVFNGTGWAYNNNSIVYFYVPKIA